MKTNTILFIIVLIMHTNNFINITIFNSELNGFLLLSSNMLFLLAVFFFGLEYRAYKRKRSNVE
jgi:hypothetical protein